MQTAGAMGVGAMRVVLQEAGAAPTEAGESPLAEETTTIGEAGEEAGVTTTGAGVL